MSCTRCTGIWARLCVVRPSSVTSSAPWRVARKPQWRSTELAPVTAQLAASARKKMAMVPLAPRRPTSRSVKAGSTVEGSSISASTMIAKTPFQRPVRP